MLNYRKGCRESVRWVWQGFTLHSWQQTPCAHSAPIFSVQLLALQHGLEHSFVVKETETENVRVKDQSQSQRGRKRDRGSNETLSWPPLPHNHTPLLPPGIRFHSAGPRTWPWYWEGWTNTSLHRSSGSASALSDCIGWRHEGTDPWRTWTFRSSWLYSDSSPKMEILSSFTKV